MTERVAIERIDVAGDGLPLIGYEGARIKCSECDGWTELVCPHGCGVRVESTAAEDLARYREQMRVQAQERKARREESRRWREAQDR